MMTPWSVLWPSDICVLPSPHKEKNSAYISNVLWFFPFAFIQLFSLKMHNLGRVCIYHRNYVDTCANRQQTNKWKIYQSTETTLKISNSTNQQTKYSKADLDSEGILTFHRTESFITVFTWAGMSKEILAHPQSQTGEPSIVGHPWLLVQYQWFCTAMCYSEVKIYQICL